MTATVLARHRQMDAVRVRVELTMLDLWVRYAGLTGTGDLIDLEGFLQGLTSLEAEQEIVLAQALNEALEEDYRARCIAMPKDPAGDGSWPEAAHAARRPGRSEHLTRSR